LEVFTVAGVPETKTYIGGVNLEVPWALFDRFGATMPFGTLRVHEEQVQLSGAPKFLTRSVSLSAPWTTAFRSHGLLAWGVGLRSVTTVHYFWTLRAPAILEVLARHGFIVSDDESPTIVELLPRWRGPMGPPFGAG
jgi:hypothetical protein